VTPGAKTSYFDSFGCFSIFPANPLVPPCVLDGLIARPDPAYFPVVSLIFQYLIGSHCIFTTTTNSLNSHVKDSSRHSVGKSDLKNIQPILRRKIETDRQSDL
jgi:hypothetical protein